MNIFEENVFSEIKNKIKETKEVFGKGFLCKILNLAKIYILSDFQYFTISRRQFLKP